jgi:hypothetical protein
MIFEEFEINDVINDEIIINSTHLNSIMFNWRNNFRKDLVDELLSVKNDIITLHEPKDEIQGVMGVYYATLNDVDIKNINSEIEDSFMKIYSNPILISKILEKGLTKDYCFIYELCLKILDWEFNGDGNGNYEYYFSNDWLDDPIEVSEYFIHHFEHTKLERLLNTPEWYAVMSELGTDIVSYVEHELE